MEQLTNIMATRIDSHFDHFDLTQEELDAGATLSILQKMFIQNQLHDCTVRRLNIEVDPTNNLKFIQEEAAIKGEIASYLHLLQCSDAVEEDQKQRLLKLRNNT